MGRPRRACGKTVQHSSLGDLPSALAAGTFPVVRHDLPGLRSESQNFATMQARPNNLGCLVTRVVGVVLTRVVIARIAAAPAIARLIAGVVGVVFARVEVGARSNPLLELVNLKATRLHGGYVHDVTS
jgi:hypothetical protein